jgi:hypothetical protein
LIIGVLCSLLERGIINIMMIMIHTKVSSQIRSVDARPCPSCCTQIMNRNKLCLTHCGRCMLHLLLQANGAATRCLHVLVQMPKTQT